jgi:glutamine synthetase
MQLLKDIAKKHGLRCLLHEKPFKGVNGSGKHNNWSVMTNTEINLFYPGNDPLNNLPFLATLACVVKGVDEYADLLRLSIVTPGNDHRLGGNEAPPAIISMFLGDRINDVIDSIIEGKEFKKTKKSRFQVGVSVIPDFAKDNTDRNRTSPFALTGRKFEFRGVGSSQPIGFVNTILNCILAKEMKEMSRLIEEGDKPLDVIKSFLKEHKRIIFEGDGYSSTWEEEALRRGLSHRKNNVEAIEVLKNKKMTDILVELDVINQTEIESRYEILLENYAKTIQVEASTALKMARNEIYPAIIKHLKMLSKTCINLKELNIDNGYLLEEIKEISELTNKMQESMNLLEKNINEIKEKILSNHQKAIEYRDKILYEYDTYKYNEAIDFMLLEEDYKTALRKKGIPFGYSRGSVSGSVIAYLLGITEVDSIKYNLNFER